MIKEKLVANQLYCV